jgi:predicted alpha/beta-hydrolase family hydrolase
MARDRVVHLPEGESRLVIDAPVGGAGAGRSVVVLGHGAGGGPGARDLSAIAGALCSDGHLVLRFVQPYRVAGRKVPGPAAGLDAAMASLVEWLRSRSAGALRLADRPLVLGGRSSGARVACRTSRTLGAVGVVCLAFPLRPPGRPEVTRIDELARSVRPTLVLQGSADVFGDAASVRRELRIVAADDGIEVVEIERAGHELTIGRSAIASVPVLAVEATRVFLDALAPR